MAPSRPAPSLVVRTPRHASRRVRPALAAEVKRIAKQRKTTVVDIGGKTVVIDPTHPLGIASDNASEWNSLLITARAERGPQWDVALQRFMVDYGSNLYFDPTPLTLTDEPTPPPDDSNAAGPSSGDPSASWQSDPRFAQYNGGSVSGPINMSNVPTPSRTSLRLQQQQHQHPHQPLNGHGNGMAMGNPYPYGLTNGRTPEQQHYAQTQVPQSYYDGSQSQSHTPSHGQSPSHTPHALTNGITIGGAGSPMMGRQMSMGAGMGMGVEFGGMGSAQETPSPDVRRRTRSQQDGHMEIGW